MPLPEKQKQYSFADVLSWDEGEHIEIINGEAFMMATPSRIHQEICFEIGRQLGNYLDGKNCKVYLAPFAVRLFEKDGDRPENVDTMVEPDISVVCDRSKLDHYGCKGAPDMVIEVLSPSTRMHDRITKFNLYQQAGVREYWIVDPSTEEIEIFLLKGGHYWGETLISARSQVPVSIFPGCTIDLSRAFLE